MAFGSDAANVAGGRRAAPVVAAPTHAGVSSRQISIAAVALRPRGLRA
jgi:hypothetical protein